MSRARAGSTFVVRSGSTIAIAAAAASNVKAVAIGQRTLRMRVEESSKLSENISPPVKKWTPKA
jgi:hypothetical protein